MRSREISRNVSGELESNSENSQKVIQLMELIARLENMSLTREQYFGGAVIGAAADVYDSAFDKYDINSAKQNGQFLEEALLGNLISEGLDPALQRSVKMAQDNLNPIAFEVMQRLNRAQIRSIEQRTNSSISEVTLQDLTKEKGASALLLVAAEVNPNLSEEKKTCYEQLGYLVQLVDDYVDKGEDSESGIITLATVSEYQQSLVNLIHQQCQTTRAAFINAYGELKSCELLKYIDWIMARGGFGSGS